MKKNQIWINTRVELQWNKATQQYDEVSVEGYWADADSVAYAHNTPNLDQDSYAWYNDGTESGSTIIGTANNSQSITADTTVLIRFLLQEDNGGSSSNFTAQLEYDVNNSGTFNNVTSTSNNVRAVTSGSLGTDGADTTQRLGSGTFLTTNGGVDNGDGAAGGSSLDFAGNDEAEVVYAIQLRSADLTNGDTVQLRVAGMNTYTNTANATASVPNNITVTLTGQSLTATGGTLTIARNFKKSISTTGQSLTATGGTLTVTQTSATVVDLTGEAVALTSGSTSITREKNISVAGDSLTATGGALNINAEKSVTLTGEAVALTAGTLTVVTTTNYAIDPIGESVATTAGALSITRNFRKDISLTAESVAVTEGTLVVTAAQNTDVNLTGEALTASGGTLSVDRNFKKFVDVTGESVAVTGGSLSVTQNLAKDISLTGEAVAVSAGTLSIARNLRVEVSLSGDSVPVTEGTIAITTDGTKEINLVGDTISVTSGSIRYTKTRRSEIDNGHAPIVLAARGFDQLYSNGTDWFTY